MSFDKRFYGVYQGIVVDNKDPENRGRVTVQVPQVTGFAVTDWVDVCGTGGGLFTPASAYGSFYDTASQTAAATNTGYPISINTTAESSGVSIDALNNSRIKFEHSGTYNIQFSLQIASTNSSLQKVQVWINKNGVAVPQSAGQVTLSGNGASALMAWNYVLSLAANDYIEFYWATDDTSTRISSAISPIDGAPASPSIIVTANAVGNVIPNPNQTVWVMYIAGDPNFPVWMGVLK